MHLALIDGNSVFARSYYASPDDAVEIGLMLMFNTLKEIKPSHLLICWDAGQKSNKNREPKPEDYSEKRDKLKSFLTSIFGEVHAEIEGYEADDIIATVAYANALEQITVVSSDKDLTQLVGGKTGYYNLATKGYLSKNVINRKWGIKRPVHLSIALAIIGDHVDGIPGIKGWGKKKVEKLFSAVDERMTFSESLKVIENQIPDNLKDDFYSSLDQTILDPSVPNVPPFVEMKLPSSREVSRLKVGDRAFDAYLRLHDRNESGDVEADFISSLETQNWKVAAGFSREISRDGEL